LTQYECEKSVVSTTNMVDKLCMGGPFSTILW